MQVMQGALGGALVLLQAPLGASSTGASGGRCAPAQAVRAGGPVHAPPSPRGGCEGDNGEGLHGALREPATRSWEGTGNQHLTRGAQSFRRAPASGVGGGRGGSAHPAPNPYPPRLTHCTASRTLMSPCLFSPRYRAEWLCPMRCPPPPIPPTALHKNGVGWSGRQHDQGGATLRPSITLPTIASLGCRGGASAARRRCGGTGSGWCSAIGPRRQ